MTLPHYITEVKDGGEFRSNVTFLIPKMLLDDSSEKIKPAANNQKNNDCNLHGNIEIRLKETESQYDLEQMVAFLKQNECEVLCYDGTYCRSKKESEKNVAAFALEHLQDWGVELLDESFKKYMQLS